MWMEKREVRILFFLKFQSNRGRFSGGLALRGRALRKSKNRRIPRLVQGEILRHLVPQNDKMAFLVILNNCIVMLSLSKHLAFLVILNVVKNLASLFFSTYAEILRRLRLLKDDKLAQYCHSERDRIVILNASALSTGSVKT